MTLEEVIGICNELRPGNAYSDELKTRWLNELQGMINVQIHLEPLGVMEGISYKWPDDRGSGLTIPLPYDRMYWLYLLAMVDFTNGDYEKYKNTYDMFNEVLRDYRLWYITMQEPGKRPFMPKVKGGASYET